MTTQPTKLVAIFAGSLVIGVYAVALLGWGWLLRRWC